MFQGQAAWYSMELFGARLYKAYTSSVNLIPQTLQMASDLAHHPLFRQKVEFLSPNERVALSYQRARLVLRTHSLTADDVVQCSKRFWKMMSDPILCLDIAMYTILAAHVGLTIGTLGRYLKRRPDFKPLVDRLLRLDTVGIYLLSERGHGLDAFNIETTATRTSTGYILNTPHEEASKFMPASTPAFGVPKVALVMARLIVSGEDRGSRFFVVPICNETEMYTGVSSIRLPTRSGTSPLDFSITRFDHVHLPHTALVAPDLDDAQLALPRDPLSAWWEQIWRIQLGTLSVSGPWIHAIKAAAYIGGKYSMHRCLTDRNQTSGKIPIISFRTQQWPVAHSLAVGMVLSAWWEEIVGQSMDTRLDSRVKHGMAVVAKTTIVRHFQRCTPEMAERCGAQGTFEQNYLARIENDGKGVIIAEGDVLTLCIRLFSELLQERYTIPLPSRNTSILSRHAHAVLEENQGLMRDLGFGHRDPLFNSLILPQSQVAIEALGHALAYASGVKAGLPQEVLDVYECAVIRQDPAWYVESGCSTRIDQRRKEDAAVSKLMVNLDAYLDGLGIADYVSAPIVSDDRWKAYVGALPVFTGNAPVTSLVGEDQIQMLAML